MSRDTLLSAYETPFQHLLRSSSHGVSRKQHICAVVRSGLAHSLQCPHQQATGVHQLLPALGRQPSICRCPDLLPPDLKGEVQPLNEKGLLRSGDRHDILPNAIGLRILAGAAKVPPIVLDILQSVGTLTPNVRLKVSRHQCTYLFSDTLDENLDGLTQTANLWESQWLQQQ